MKVMGKCWVGRDSRLCVALVQLVWIMKYMKSLVFTVYGFIFRGYQFSWTEQKLHIIGDQNLWPQYLPS